MAEMTTWLCPKCFSENVNAELICTACGHEIPRTRMAEMTPEEQKLNSALCNFCNQAGDPFEPASQWDDYVWKAFGHLCKAYNEWYKHVGTERTEAVAAERAACAEVAREHTTIKGDWTDFGEGYTNSARKIAAAIEARGKQEGGDADA